MSKKQKPISAYPLETDELLKAFLNTEPPEKITLQNEGTGKKHTFYSDKDGFIRVPKDNWIVLKPLRLREGIIIKPKD